MHIDEGLHECAEHFRLSRCQIVELEEEASEGLYWAISSYDPNICRVEMEHDRGGVWPFRYDKAEIDLKGVAPGTTTVVFTRPDGKTFRVLFTVR